MITGVLQIQSTKSLLRYAVRLAIAAPVAALLCGPSPALAVPYLGTAQSFAVLGSSTVTNTGTTRIHGDVGAYPGTSLTGMGTAVITGSQYPGIPPADQARTDATTAFNILAGLPVSQVLTGQDLGSVGTLSPGVYQFASSAQLTGTLILDFASNPGGSFVFQMGSTLTTASNSLVNVLNGASNSGIYWEVGSSATLGTGTTFAGNIIALASVTLTTNASIMCGRAIALTGAVTMDTNTISNDCSSESYGTGRVDYGSVAFSGAGDIPEPASLLILTMGVIGAATVRWTKSAAQQRVA